MKCPICINESRLKLCFSESEIKDLLFRHFNQVIPDEVKVESEYKIFVCNNCSLTFANPQIPGSESFYKWITSQKDYYPNARWEYFELRNIINRKKGDVKVFDVGCGDGIFFDVISGERNGNIFFSGLDLTYDSVVACNRKGYDVHCLDIKEYKEKFPDIFYDFVVSFHVLEHVPDPVGFVSDLASLINENGEIYISTPFSPMTIECDWIDILNYPPHHLSRWNKKAYIELAKKLNLNLEFFSPIPWSTVGYAIQSFLMSENKTVIKFVKKEYFKIIKMVLRSPFKFIKHFMYQYNREKINGIKHANLVMIKLSKKSKY